MKRSCVGFGYCGILCEASGYMWGLVISVVSRTGRRSGIEWLVWRAQGLN